MESPSFKLLYEQTKDSFEKENFDETVLNDIYNACLTNLIYDKDEKIFKNKKNGREYVFDETKLQFYPKINRLKEWDMFVEFDEKDSFRVTTVKDDDLIIMGGHAKSHNINIVANPVCLDYKWSYYIVIPNVVAKLRQLKIYDDYGLLIELNIKDACTWLQYIKDIKDVFRIEVEGNSLDSIVNYNMMKNYMTYIEETLKLNYVTATLDDKPIEKRNKTAIDYKDGFTQAIDFSSKYYKDIMSNPTNYSSKLFRRE